MVEAFDRTWLEAWLTARRATDRVLHYVIYELGGPAPELDDRECSVVLDALLTHAVEPAVHLGRVHGLKEVAAHLGYSEDVLEGFVQDTLRITVRRLEAFGALRLPLGATADDVKLAHRRLVKQVHPDRHPGANPESVEAAARRVMVLNQARALLNQPYEDVILDGGDDVLLDGDPGSGFTAGGPSPLDRGLDLGSFVVPPLEPDEEDEDAPTELYDEVSWSDLERVGLLPSSTDPTLVPDEPPALDGRLGPRDESTEIELHAVINGSARDR